MLPWPVRPRMSHRLEASTTLRPRLPEPKSLAKKPTFPSSDERRATSDEGQKRDKRGARGAGGSVILLPSSLVARRSSLSHRAVVDDPGDLGAQVAAVDDPVHEPVLEQELAGLEALGQFQADR